MAENKLFHTVRMGGLDEDEVLQYLQQLLDAFEKDKNEYKRRIEEQEILIEEYRTKLNSAKEYQHYAYNRIEKQQDEILSLQRQLHEKESYIMKHQDPGMQAQGRLFADPLAENQIQADVDKILKNAQLRAGKLLEEARSEADKVVAQARTEAGIEKEKAQEYLASVKASVSELWNLLKQNVPF